MENFNKRVNEAAAKYLDRRGYDILEEPWKTSDEKLPVDIVAQEDDSLVFVNVMGRKAEQSRKFSDEIPGRDKLEAFAIDWFSENSESFTDCHFRFDSISMLVINKDRALIRHHVNTMSVDCDPEEE